MRSRRLEKTVMLGILLLLGILLWTLLWRLIQ